jgi:DNA repair exonuclease SbcCD ATPase subunit
MSEEQIVTADAPAASQAATETTPDTTSELEALRAKYQKAQEDIKRFRTRAQEVEEARRQAEEAKLASQPLEERLKALESEKQTLAQSLEQKEAELAVRELRGQLRDAGVPKETLDDALDLYLAAVDRAPEGEEPELADFLKSRPYLVPNTKAPPTLPGAPSGVGAGRTSLAQQAEEARNAGNIALYIALSEKAKKEANA